MGKSKAVKPTRNQKERIRKAGLEVDDWLVLYETDDGLHLVHRASGKSRHIKK